MLPSSIYKRRTRPMRRRRSNDQSERKSPRRSSVLLIALATFVVLSLCCGMVGLYWLDTEGQRNQENRCELSTARTWVQPGQTTALSMMQDTGETWIREVLERATQRLTVSMHCKSDIGTHKFKADCQDFRMSPLTLSYSPMRNNTDAPRDWFGATIYIPRNPFDVIAAWYFREHVGEREDMVTYFPMQSVVEGARLFKEHFEFWRTNSKEMLLVRYEDLRREPEAHFGRLALFLGEIISDQRISCALQATEASVTQSDVGGDLFQSLQYFEAESQKFVTEYLRDILCDLGYFDDVSDLDCDPEWISKDTKRKAEAEELEEERRAAVKENRNSRRVPWRRKNNLVLSSKR